MVQPTAEHVHRVHGRAAARDRECPRREEMTRRVDEEFALERREGIEQADRPPESEEQTLPYEHQVEIQRGIDEILRLQVGRQRERAVENRRLVGIVDSRQPVPDAKDSERHGQQANGREREPPGSQRSSDRDPPIVARYDAASCPANPAVPPTSACSSSRSPR